MLREIWRADRLNRSDLARLTGLSTSTISAITGGLIEARIVREVEAGDPNGGRRPTMLELVGDSGVAVGIEFAIDRIEVLAITLRGHRVDHRTAIHPVRTDPAGSLEFAAAIVKRLLRVAEIPDDIVWGVGVALPTPIVGGGTQADPTIFPAWGGIDVVADLRSRLPYPIMLDNSGNLGALAEHWWGAGAELDQTFVDLGIGVTAGHVIGGRVHQGHSGWAGELGHLRVTQSGVCRCGKTGCLEAAVGIDRLAERYGNTFDLLLQAAAAGKEWPRQIIRAAGTDLGHALAMLITLLDPARIVLGGRLTEAGDLLLEAIRQTVGARIAGPTDRVEVVFANSKDLPVVTGAATSVLERALVVGLVPDGGIKRDDGAPLTLAKA